MKRLVRLCRLPSLAVRSRMPRQRRGFTLVEVLIVVAIAGLLAALTVPSFLSQLRKTRRVDAVLALTEVQQAQERWRANNPTYTANLTAKPTDSPPGLGLSATSQDGYYTISILSDPAPTATRYTVRASAVTGKSQAADTGCTVLDLVVTNGVASRAQENCWSK